MPPSRRADPALRRLLIVIPFFAILAGCQTGSIGGPPPLSPVGVGLVVDGAVLPVSAKQPDVRAPSSLWSQSDQGLFRDLRAHRVGDVVTVSIDINDQAQFDNASGRSKQGSVKGAFTTALKFGGFGVVPDQSGAANGSLDASGSASAKGEGTINRSEKLQLSIAAVVAEVLPDGNLLISGSQEVRVNNEVRVLNIAGIVRPLDISAGNMIAYDKIAEARVSYGGRGKLSAVQ
jgi:flagellar L-ring protein precursor FlgH